MIIQTSSVCAKPANLYAIGNTFVSDLCGGGAYDLPLISSKDLYFNTGGSYLFFNPCGQVRNSTCGDPSNPIYISLCEAYNLVGGNSYRIAVYDPVRSPVSYTLIPNGLTQYSASGDSTGNYPRALNVTYVCNAAATTPYITSYSSVSIPQPTAPAAGSYQTLYQLVVQTSVVCGAAFQKQPCGANGFDLSSLVGTTLGGNYNGAYYTVAPCSSVIASATNGCTGQACQSGYPLSYYDPAGAKWTTADYGLIQQTQDGVFCGTAFARATTIRFICNPSATTPYLSNAGEGPVCQPTLSPLHTLT